MDQHLLITRFNIRMGFSDEKRFSSEWLDSRFRLFDQYCYPSVRHQTNTNFKWIVLFDEQTPSEYLDRIEIYSAWDRFVPIFVKRFDSHTLNEGIRSNIPRGTGRVITTRLDNDDAISCDYIDRVQKIASASNNEVIDFVNGYVLDSRNGKLYSYSNPLNPFATLVEQLTDSPVKTVLGVEHKQLSKFGTVNSICESPQWLVVVHNNNVTNHVHNRLVRVRNSALVSRFIIQAEIIPESGLSISLENLIRNTRWKLGAILPKPLKVRIRKFL